MATDVTLPGVGPVSRKALLIGGGAAVVVTGVIWWRKRSTPAPAPATDTSALDTSNLDTSGLGSGGGSLGAGIGGTTASFGNPTSNPQWTAVVMQDLSGVVDPSALASALGLYLTGSAVTADQTSIIDQAIAVAGYPPVSGPNGYPPAIHTQAGGGQTPPPPPPPPTPAPGGGGGTTGSTDWTTHTTVHEGERLSQVLGFFGMSQSEFEAHNPGISSYYRPYIAGRGYVPAGTPGAVIALNTGHDVIVLVKTGGW